MLLLLRAQERSRLRLGRHAVRGKVDLVDAILQGLCVIATPGKCETLVWSRGDTATQDKSEATGERFDGFHDAISKQEGGGAIRKLRFLPPETCLR